VPWMKVEIVNVDGSKEKSGYTLYAISQLDPVVDCNLNWPRVGICDDYKTYAWLSWFCLVCAFAIVSASLMLEVKGTYHIRRGDLAPRLFRNSARLSAFGILVAILAPMTWFSNFFTYGRVQRGYFIGSTQYEPPLVCDHVAWTLLGLTTPIDSVVVSSINTDCLDFDNFGMAFAGFLFSLLHGVSAASMASKQEKLAEDRNRLQRLAAAVSAAGGGELSNADVAVAVASIDQAHSPELVAWRLKAKDRRAQAAPAETRAQQATVAVSSDDDAALAAWRQKGRKAAPVRGDSVI
jgi:hypothetical protein